MWKIFAVINKSCDKWRERNALFFFSLSFFWGSNYCKEFPRLLLLLLLEAQTARHDSALSLTHNSSLVVQPRAFFFVLFFFSSSCDHLWSINKLLKSDQLLHFALSMDFFFFPCSMDFPKHTSFAFLYFL